MATTIRTSMFVCLLTLCMLPSNLKATDDKPKKSKTGLMFAIMYEQKKTIKLLVEKEVDLYEQDKNGNTAMHYAAYKNDIKTMKLLHAKGLELYFKAAEKQRKKNEPINELISLFLMVRSKNQKGETPLHLASAEGNFKAIKWLLRKKAYSDAKNTAGKTPVDYAEMYDQPKVVQLFANNTQNSINKK